MPNIDFNFGLPITPYTPVISNIPTQTAIFNGITTGVFNLGLQYNFWGQGSTAGAGSLANGTVYYVMTGSDFAPLSNWFVGDPAQAWMNIQSGTNRYSFPLNFDRTGIWFLCDTGGVSFTAGATIGFTQMLFLAPS